MTKVCNICMSLNTIYFWQLLMLVLKTSGRRRVTQQYCHTIHTFLSVFTTFTGDKTAARIIIVIPIFLNKKKRKNSPAVTSRSDFLLDWIPLRAHECRRQCEFTSACHKKKLYTADLCAQVFYKKKQQQQQEGSACEASGAAFCGWNEGDGWPQVFSSSPRAAAQHEGRFGKW